MPGIGEPAPDFALPNQDGETIRLSDYRGRKVVLFAFPKANTPGCTAQACSFQDALPRMESANAIIFGISADSQRTLRGFKERQNLSYDLLSDTQHEVLEAWDAWGPSIFGLIKLPAARRSYWVIDENGTVIDMQVDVGPQKSMEQALATVLNNAAK